MGTVAGADLMKLTVVQFGAALAGLLVAGSAASQDSSPEGLEQLTALVIQPLADRASDWVCTPSVRYVCGPDGCEQHPALVSVRLDLNESTYARCNSDGCETYPMNFAPSGIFTTFQLRGRGGTFLKVYNDGSEYVEVASLLLGIQQSFGVCEPRM
jgi:hypothetical protein